VADNLNSKLSNNTWRREGWVYLNLCCVLFIILKRWIQRNIRGWLEQLGKIFVMLCQLKDKTNHGSHFLFASQRVLYHSYLMC
jgi:hypothetical protein